MAVSMKQFLSQTISEEAKTDNPQAATSSDEKKWCSPTDLLNLLQVGEAEYGEFYRQVAVMRLCHAGATDNVEVVKSMLASGIDVNSRDYEQRTLLHIAAGAGSECVVKELLRWKAAVQSVDMWGNTPLEQAEKAKHPRVVELLKGAPMELDRRALESLKGAPTDLDSSLNRKAISQLFPISREQIDYKDVLCTTNKSTVRRATWLGADVVVKFTKIGDQAMDNVGKSIDHGTISPYSVTTECMDEIELELLHEVKILAAIRHPDLVQFLGACFEHRPVMFVLEYMAGGDLDHYYQAKSRETNKLFQPGLMQVVKWASAVARALSFLHCNSNPIIHRDLKPMNLLLTKTLEVKVGDFGISKMATRASFEDSDMMTGGVGSWRYMAPEVVRGLHYTEKADIFSFGLILYFMASGRRPFWDLPNEDDCLKEYLKGNEPRPRESECPEPLRKVMVSAWNSNPQMRPSAADLTQDFVGLTASPKACCTVS